MKVEGKSREWKAWKLAGRVTSLEHAITQNFLSHIDQRPKLIEEWQSYQIAEKRAKITLDLNQMLSFIYLASV